MTIHEALKTVIDSQKHYRLREAQDRARAEDPCLIPGLGRSPGEENGNPLQYSCLENPMDREAWRATVHGLQRVGHNRDATNTFTLLPSPSSVTLDKLRDLSKPQLGLL